MTLLGLVGYFLDLRTFGFDGPIALVGYVNKDLAEKRKCCEPHDYK